MQFNDATQFGVIRQECLATGNQSRRNLQGIWCSQSIPGAQIGCALRDDRVYACDLEVIAMMEQIAVFLLKLGIVMQEGLHEHFCESNS
jgi:hypothetical protein